MVCCPNLSVSAPVVTPRRGAAQAQDSVRRDVGPRCSETHANKGVLIRCARVLKYQGVSLVLWKSSVLGVSWGGGGAPISCHGRAGSGSIWVLLTRHVDLKYAARPIAVLINRASPGLFQVVADSRGAGGAALVAEDHFCGSGSRTVEASV